MPQVRPVEAAVGETSELVVSLHGREGILFLTIDDGSTRMVYVNSDVPRLLDIQDMFDRNVA